MNQFMLCVLLLVVLGNLVYGIATYVSLIKSIEDTVAAIGVLGTICLHLLLVAVLLLGVFLVALMGVALTVEV